jgi:preprotein translocase subunit Sec63
VLGVPSDATIDAVRLAYEQARAKYDLEQVADLGLEVRDHYTAKAAAAERAYQTIVDALSVPPDSEQHRERARLLDRHPESAPLGVSS